MALTLKEVDKVEILTLQDNYIDIASRDDTEIIKRAPILQGMEVKNTILAEHGFSALVTVTQGREAHGILFDFGFSDFGAAYNAEALGLDLTKVEALALSHGHLDHVGGLKRLVELVGKKGLEMVLHPAAFRNPRYMKITDEPKAYFPAFTREKAEAAGVTVVETKEPYPLLDSAILFLGEIARTTDFEKGAPSLCYEADGVERQDTFEDDTAIVALVKGKGLVVLSGCAHSGIVNTVRHAQKVTGVDKILAVMGGFHLTGPDMKPVIAPTTTALKEIDPAYIVPTHCTGRNAVMNIEKEMPDKFLLNMSGTTLTFSA